MKQLQIYKGLFLAGCVALWACTDRRSAGETTAEAMPAGTVAFNGGWVNSKYVQTLRQSKSPRVAQGAAELSALVVPSMTDQPALLIWGFHEASDYVLKTEADGRTSLHNAAGEECTYVLEYAPEGDSLKVGKDWFVRLASGNKPDQAANEYLFAGQYRLGDREVTFASDGKVTGLDSIRYYKPNLDYIDAGMQVDQVQLGRTADSLKTYSFSIRNNTLSLYRLNCTDYDSTYQTCNVVANGLELLRLEKQSRE